MPFLFIILRRPMPNISGIVMTTQTSATRTQVPGFVDSKPMLSRLKSINCSLYHTSLFVGCYSHHLRLYIYVEVLNSIFTESLGNFFLALSASHVDGELRCCRDSHFSLVEVNQAIL